MKPAKTAFAADAPDANDAHTVNPRRGGLIAAAVYAACVLALGWPALAGNFLAGEHSDQFIAGYAFREFGAHTLRTTGSFPLWNPYQFGGMPFVAAMHGDIFYPTFLLRMIMPTDVAMTWGYMIHVFLAGFLTYIFLRRARFGFAGALIGGLAYMMSGHIATFVSPGHDGKLFVTALFPLLLWAVLAWMRDGKRWALGALALIVGLDLLTPHPQLLQYSLLAAGAYAIVLAIGAVRDKETDSKGATTRLGLALGAVVLGLAIGAVQYLPVREYVAWSPRAGGIGTYDRATSFAKNPPEIINAYLPEFTGILDHYWGENGIHFQGDYAGVAVLILAGAGLVGFRRDRRSRDLWFWIGAIIISLLWSLGAHTPFYNIPFYLIPGTRYFRAPDMAFFVGTFGIAVFAARGTERALSGLVTRRFAIGWTALAVIVALLAVTGGLTNLAHSLASAQALDLVDANASALTFGAFRGLLVTILIIGLVWKGREVFRQNTPGLLLAIALVVAADLFAVDHQYWMFSPPARTSLASTPAIDFLRSLPQPARVIPLEAAEGGSSAVFQGSALMSHDVLNTIGYHGNELARYNDLVGIAQGGGPSQDTYQSVLGDPNVQRLTATQYVLTNSQRFASMVPTAVLVAGPKTNDPTGHSDYVYRLPLSTPYAWVAPVIVKSADDTALAIVRNPRFDVTSAAIFAPDAPVTAVTVRQLPAPIAVTARVTRYAAGHVALALDAPAPAGSALIVSENYYPGWKATIDGKPATIGRVQYSLIGVPLSTGARTIDLDFTSAPYETGKLVTWIAILVSLLVLGWGVVAERRSVA